MSLIPVNTELNTPYSRGFTLLELAVVVAIIGVLAAMAYPSMTSQIANMRIKSAKSSIAAAFKDAQAQSLILRKPVWVSVEKNSKNEFALVVTDSDPTTNPAPLSKMPLPKSIRLMDSSGTVSGNINTLRVTPSGILQEGSGNDFNSAEHTFFACDTILSGRPTYGLEFKNRSVPLPQGNSTPSIICNL